MKHKNKKLEFKKETVLSFEQMKNIYGKYDCGAGDDGGIITKPRDTTPSPSPAS